METLNNSELLNQLFVKKILLMINYESLNTSFRYHSIVSSYVHSSLTRVCGILSSPWNMANEAWRDRAKTLRLRKQMP